ncbi:hypothetical protein V5799_019113 [Amblyomma americanum]|uniref:Secreted protein n=1 Tax=Amblyomma americanum TaxID=6943 RepID=A0AAQ4EXT0_AMBAM
MNNSLLILLQVVAYSAQVLPEHGLVNVSWNTAFLCAAQETGAAATSFDEWQWTGNRCVGTAPGASTLSAEAFSLNLPVPDFGSGLGGTGKVVAYSAQVLPEHGLVNVSWNTAFLCAAQETGAAATSFDEWQWTGNRCVGTAPGASTLSAEAFSLNLPVPDFGSGLGGTGKMVAYSAQVLPEHGLVNVSWNTAFLCAAQETGAAATSFDEWQWTGNPCVGTAPGASTLSAEAFSLNLPVPDFGSGLGGTGKVVAYSAQVLPEHGLVNVSWNTAFLCAAQETGAAATSFDEWQWTGNRCVGTAPGASTLSAEAFSLNLPVPDFGSGLGGTGKMVAYSAQVLPEHGLVNVSWNTAFLCAAQETGAAATSFDEWQWTGNRCVGTAPGASTLSAEAFSLNLPVPDFGSGLGGTGKMVAYSAQVLPEHGLVNVSWNTAFLCAAQETGAAATSFDEWQWTGNRCVGTAPGASTLSAEAFSLNLPVPDFGSGLGGTGKVVAYSAQVLPEHGLVNVSWNTAFLCAAQETGAAATSFDEWQWTGNRCVGTAPGASTLSAEAFSLNLPVPDFGSGLGGTGKMVAYSAQVLPEHGLVNVSWNTAFLCAAQETGAAATSFDEWQWTGNRCVGTAPGASTLSAEAFSLNLPVPDFGSGLGDTGANRMNNSLLTLLQNNLRIRLRLSKPLTQKEQDMEEIHLKIIRYRLRGKISTRCQHNQNVKRCFDLFL